MVKEYSMRKYIAITLVLIVLLITYPHANPPALASRSGAVYNATTGEFLYEHLGDTPQFPASTTKMLTALIILENTNLSETVVTPSHFKPPGGSHIAIDYGEEFTVEQLLYALLVESANDAAVVLALHHSGSLEAFSEVMNQKARSLGATNSNFVNPHGLHHPDHVSTAKDLALIATEAMKNPLFRKMVTTPQYTIGPTNKKSETRNYIRTGNRFVRNTGNTMIYNGKTIPIFDERMDGVKTGYTPEAGNCLVSSTLSDGARLITVVLGAGPDNLVYVDSKLLMDYAMSAFTSIRLISEGEIVTNIKVKHAENSGLNLVAASTLAKTVQNNISLADDVEKIIELYDLPEGAIERGLPLGLLNFVKDGTVIASTELLAERDISSRDLLGELTWSLSTKSTLQYPMDYIIIGLKLLLSIVIWRMMINRRNRRAKKRERDSKLASLRETIDYDEYDNVFALKSTKK